MSRTRIPVALRRLVRARAGGRCEYCLHPEAYSFVSHEVDHVTAEKHGGATEATNLALACDFCNGYKGSDIASLDPLTGALVELFHPRRHSWTLHFGLEDGRIVALTGIGRATVRLLQLNHPDRVRQRVMLIALNEIRVPPSPETAP